MNYNSTWGDSGGVVLEYDPETLRLVKERGVEA